MSLATIIADIENDVATTEADVYNWVVQIKSGLAVAESYVSAGLKWLASAAPAIVTDLQDALKLAQSVPGLTIPATVVTAADAAAAGLTALAQAENSGQSNSATLVAGYSAVVSAVSAKAGVQQTVLTAPTPSAAS